ncbi:hypothetical protein [Elizabethkingia anophelis]|uniref:hypothetical protein n=2 Tax=Elizabethkingia anophelis TaxID=1117645 RepID=UPI00320841CC
MIDKKNTCYMCDNEAVSMEHVPPICLFPEMKDTKGINFRKNLIKIPSCDIHNSNKSDDDEFLLLSLTGLITNNNVGQYHFYTKVNRAIRRKNKDFINKHILRNHKYGVIKINGEEKFISMGQPDADRLTKCFEHIANGLYYYRFGKRFIGEIHMIKGFINYNDSNRQMLKKFLKRRFELETVLNEEIQGENPQVFYYQFHKPDEYGLIAVKMVFYGTAEVYVCFKPKDIEEPFNLGMKLIEGGVKTTITLGDEEFPFNQ